VTRWMPAPLAPVPVTVAVPATDDMSVFSAVVATITPALVVACVLGAERPFVTE
jgi:hypothetical protein